MAKRWASSRIFWSIMSSHDHFSRRIGSGVCGRNTSSIRFARDMSGGIKWGECLVIASSTWESCPLPPSMMMRSGHISSPRRAQRVRLVSISSIEAKSSIRPVSRVFILYFLYLLGSGLPFTSTDLLATVCSPWLCDISKHSKTISSLHLYDNGQIFIDKCIYA